MARLLRRWECGECCELYDSEEKADDCATHDRKVIKGRCNVLPWTSLCDLIDATFQLPGNQIATELLADYICDYLGEDDRETGPSDYSVAIARDIVAGTIPMSEVLEAIASLKE